MKNKLILRENEFIYLIKSLEKSGYHSLKIGWTKDLEKRLKNYKSSGNYSEYEKTRGFSDTVDERAIQLINRPSTHTDHKHKINPEHFYDTPEVRNNFESDYKLIYSYIITNLQHLFTKKHIAGDSRTKDTAILWRSVVYEFGDSLDEIIENINKISKPNQFLILVKNKLYNLKLAIGDNKDAEILYFNYLTTFNKDKKLSLRIKVRELKKSLREKLSERIIKDPSLTDGYKISAFMAIDYGFS